MKKINFTIINYDVILGPTQEKFFEVGESGTGFCLRKSRFPYVKKLKQKNYLWPHGDVTNQLMTLGFGWRSIVHGFMIVRPVDLDE